MRYYLLIVVALVCEGARVPRITDSYPGFQGFHGQGPYQQGHNYPAGPFSGGFRPHGHLDVGNDYYGGQHSIGGHSGDHFSGVPFNVGSHGGFNSPRNYERFNHAPDYDYHL
ncbi:uncharacterized protein LOC105663750 [Megachile rotundata]|uniref:uncharacterized protein LOC105663750 n=1 Tax=Megachile rotundata TaxID=143995 RepID=UPI0006149FBC|nr:PREDICTED: uncharacterized protein LOC105663750 [Megachile rotundata]